MKRAGRPREHWLLVALALSVLAGPTVGDVGSCGQEVADLDAEKFFTEKDFIDCSKCTECSFQTRICDDACDGVPSTTAFDEDCFPLVHDGEVCLNRLRAASCGEYASYINDGAPTTPTECNFCPLSERPPSSGEPSGEGGAAEEGEAAPGPGETP